MFGVQCPTLDEVVNSEELWLDSAGTRKSKLPAEYKANIRIMFEGWEDLIRALNEGRQDHFGLLLEEMHSRLSNALRENASCPNFSNIYETLSLLRILEAQHLPEAKRLRAEARGETYVEEYDDDPWP